MCMNSCLVLQLSVWQCSTASSVLSSQTPKMILRSARESLVKVLPVPDSTFWASSFFFACSVEIFSSTVPSHSNLETHTQVIQIKFSQDSIIRCLWLIIYYYQCAGLSSFSSTQHDGADSLPVDGDIFCLSNSVDSVTCLIFQCRVPVRVYRVK